MSYSQIKSKLGVSKSTLHYWLRDYPLSEERIRELRDWNHIRIEKFRKTMALKKEKRLERVYGEMKKKINRISSRELFLAGMFLYWAEGSKTSPCVVMLSNTDPIMLCFFIQWLRSLGVQRGEIRARLHLYKDMNIERQIKLWSRMLDLPLSAFRNTYVKDVHPMKPRNYYKGRFGLGTCHVWVSGRDIQEKVIMSLEVLRSMYATENVASCLRRR